MYSVWECKLQKAIPTAEKMANDVFFMIENIKKSSAILGADMLLNLHICRCWSAEVGRRDGSG
jgi:hypothetical protein